MANYLDAHPSEAPTLECHRTDPSGQFIPTASGARFGALVNARSLTRGTCPMPSAAGDYVVGLELLGFRFELDRHADGRTDVFTLNPSQEIPASWHAMSDAIMGAFDSRARHDELVAFLLVRDGEAS